MANDLQNEVIIDNLKKENLKLRTSLEKSEYQRSSCTTILQKYIANEPFTKIFFFVDLMKKLKIKMKTCENNQNIQKNWKCS